MQILSGKALLIAHCAFPRINEENLRWCKEHFCQMANAFSESREDEAAMYVDAPGLILAHWIPSADNTLENFDQTCKSWKKLTSDSLSQWKTICWQVTQFFSHRLQILWGRGILQGHYLRDYNKISRWWWWRAEITVYFLMVRKLLPKCRNLWKHLKKTP